MVGKFHELPAERKGETSIPTRGLVEEPSEIHREGNAAWVAGGCQLAPYLKEAAQESHGLLWLLLPNLT